MFKRILLSLLLLGVLVAGLDLEMGECVFDVYSNVTYCAPQLLNSSVDLNYADFGVPSNLVYVTNDNVTVSAPAYPFNSTVSLVANESWFTTQSAWYGFEVDCVYNGSLVNASNVTGNYSWNCSNCSNCSCSSCANGSCYDEVESNCSLWLGGRLNEQVVLDFGEDYYNWELNFSCKAPDFPRVNEVVTLGVGEKYNLTGLYGLLVTCDGVSNCPQAECPSCAPSADICGVWCQDNADYCVDFSKNCSIADVDCPPIPPVVVCEDCDAKTMNNLLWLVVSVGAGIAAATALLFFKRKRDGQ